MLNKLYEWVESSVANIRNGLPAVEPSPSDRPPGDDDIRLRRKRRIESLKEGHEGDPNELPVKKSRMGDLFDTVKIAAEGLKNRSSSVATWMKNSVSPTLRNILPASSPQSLELHTLPSAARWTTVPNSEVNLLDQTFAVPATSLEWKMPKSVCRRHVHMSPAHQEVPKINGHPCSLPPNIMPKLPPSARLSRPINLRKYGTPSVLSGGSTTSSSCTSMYDKTFPIKVPQRPSRRTSACHIPQARTRCTAQESVHLEEKEAYRQLLTIVSGGQSCLVNGHSPSIARSQRDFTSFLSPSRRLLHLSSFAGSVAGDIPEGAGSPLSTRDTSSRSSSNLPSPVAASCKPGNYQTWSVDADFSCSQPSPSAVLDTCSQDTQSSAHDGDSVIIVNEQKSKKQDATSMPCFQAELWIKELTSIYDSRARERRRQIEEQEALAAQLLRQRLSEGGQRSTNVEVHVRVPLEKEIPLTLVIEESSFLDDKPEFPQLTEEMEAQVDKVLRRGSPDEVFSEGFGLSLTRKDLQTLSGLSWLNDEVINFYMNLLVERSKGPKLPSVNTFSTFFYPKLRSSGYSAVRRWTKKMDIFSKDILLVPVHLSMHWCLSVVDFRKKAVTYFDSMGGNNDDACKLLFDYLQQESKDKKGKELDTTGWTLHSKKRNEIPQQMNGSDCGMFTCKYADYITKDKPITFTQKQMPYFRRRMVWEIVNRKLL
ncbi:sentrin-specific protease 1 isoform X2 [Hippocampus comes]|uniref:sentrin-specific protease 1 isoform X1 n=1 Tax=Hippocampus comes TaxID=109280 RepID=UPI00094E6CAB|nr:PREDICTED: sentrin-specific protease 1-like isoform X1 [Hippocampus comes]XP_019751199.1 PREDICTED: sentrin-specific protease 1-like isoform X2 [Hippocampus comes]